MIEYTVDLQQKAWIDFAPATVREEVHQNLRTILTTVLGSAPGSRSIGIDYDHIDEPEHIAKARIGGSIRTAIFEQEPRVNVTSITFSDSGGGGIYGRLVPTVKYVLAEGVDG